jgi:DNA-binding LytR/AlgR family response regulator
VDLIRTIELAVSRIKDSAPFHAENAEDEEPILLNDRIFVKHRDKLVKISMADIFYVTAESNYSRIITKSKEFVLAITL